MSKILSVSRHRMATDGKGITTLVGFYGCPLRCKYCLNPSCFDENARTNELTAEELFNKVKIDDLYFTATNGGVTFGGGEPLLHPEFLKRFKEISKDRWRINIETSLNVPSSNLVFFADEYFVDVKDMNGDIYLKYTGRDNHAVIKNLSLLLNEVGSDKITVRLPLIVGFNTEEDRDKSEKLLREMGVTKLDKFTYRT